jgi:3-oxoadipate enol-lactonase
MDNNPTLHVHQAGNGRPLILIHGFPFSGRMWTRQLGSLGAKHQVLAPDLPGFGQSSATSEEASVDAYSRACAAALDASGVRGPVALGGLSMGGYIALAFARLFPERLSALLLLSTRAGADSSEGKANRDKTIAQVKEQGASVVTEGMYPKLLAPANYEAKPDAASELQDIMKDATPEGVIAALKVMRDRPDSTQSLGAIKTPTLVVHGKDDQVIPFAEAEATAKAIPNSKLVLIEGAGHMPNLEQQARFDEAVLSFLAKL